MNAADRLIQPLADAAMAVWFWLDRAGDRVRGWLDVDRYICPEFPDSTEDQP